MRIHLELIKAVTIPASTRGKWMNRVSVDASLCGRMAVPTAQSRILTAAFDRADPHFSEIQLPLNLETVAIHWKHVAILSNREIEIRDETATTIAKIDLSSSR